jgi:hypothetical protein
MEFDGFSSDDIRSIVLEIQAIHIRDEDTKRDFCKSKYAAFAEKFPRLFDAALSPHFQLHYLDFMLKKRDNLYANPTLDKANVQAADKQVYDKLREDFVDPVISSSPQS